LNPPATPLRIGTRSSRLALWQTERIRDLLRNLGYQTERIEIKTTGDLAPDVPLAQLGSRAIFTKQIDDALIQGRIDLAVHSLKDLPTELPDEIQLAAIGPREDPRDALIGRGPLQWTELPEDSLIATSSLRRRAQVLHLKPKSRVVELRGNVDTRLAKLDAHPNWTGIILATAGLVRLGLDQRIGERLSPELILPAPGQGALAVTVRRGDEAVALAVRRAVHDTTVGLTVAAERAFLRRLEGGCQVPVAAYARADSQDGIPVLHLHGRVVSLDGAAMVEGHETGTAADESSAASLGTALAERLLDRGAAAILADTRTNSAPAVTEP
jgi:hydroxymethylbilane synthase